MRKAAFIVVALTAAAATIAPGYAQRAWRPTVMSMNGMVAAGHPLAAEAGLRVLQEGGNAVDAAIASWLVQGQVEPGMTGLGGDMFVLLYLAETDEVKFINGTGPAPMAATADFYRREGGMPRDGAKSVIVPGAVGGAMMALESYGRIGRDRAMSPAIELAERGFPISDQLARQLANGRDKLGQFPSTKSIWFDDEGEPLEAGDVLVNPDLGATLRTLAAEGAEPFYRGAIGRNAVRYLRDNGGIHEISDWAGFHAHEDAPISIDYKGIEVYECPPNSQGHVMLQAMNLLEGFSLRYMGHNSAPYLHLVTESLKLAFADRNAYVSDPRFVPPIPMAEMLSDEYAAVRRALIDPERAIEGEPPAGDPRALTSPTTRLAATPILAPAMRATPGQQTTRDGLSLPVKPAYAEPRPVPSAIGEWDQANALALTTYLAVVDKDRNMVSITSSLLSGFGSGMVAEGAGFFLNNRMAYFSTDDDNANVVAPGKRTRHTINPALALKDGKPYLVFGTPGADTQPQTQLQFFLNVVEFGMGVQEALEQPAVISRSFAASYYPQTIAGTLLTPTSLPEHVKAGLAALGHELDLRDSRGVGSVKAIMIHPETGALMGGVSPTGDSYVMGW